MRLMVLAMVTLLIVCTGILLLGALSGKMKPERNPYRIGAVVTEKVPPLTADSVNDLRCACAVGGESAS